MELTARKESYSAQEKHYGKWGPYETLVALYLVLPSIRLLFQCYSGANHTEAAFLLTLI